MKYRLLGHSGLRVSELCLGTMRFGDSGPRGCDRQAAKAIFDTFGASGGNFIDTADVYADGESERLVGEFVRSDRDHFVVATKYSTTIEPGSIVKAGNARKNLRRCVELSLSRLGLDHIDLLYLHCFDGVTPMEEIVRALDDLVSDGKIGYIGVSNTPSWRIAAANQLAQLRGWSRFCAMQVPYNLAERTVEREALPMAQAFDIAVLAWAPLAHGALAGASPEASRLAEDHAAQIGLAWRILSTAAEEAGIAPAVLALTWLRWRSRQWGVVIPVLGVDDADQLRQHVAALATPFDEAIMAKLSAGTAIDLGYPRAYQETGYFRGMTTAFNVGKLVNHRQRNGD